MSFYNVLEKDIKEVYLPQKILKDTDVDPHIALVKKYKRPKCTVTFLRRWSDELEDGGYYGRIQINAEDFSSMNMPDISHMLRSSLYCMTKDHLDILPRIHSVRFAYINDRDLCMLLINTYLHDTNSTLRTYELPKEIIFNIVSQIVNINLCIENEMKTLGEV